MGRVGSGHTASERARVARRGQLDAAGTGHIVRSSDPFKIGEEKQRPWLIVNTASHPFADEQHIAVAVSTKEYDDSIRLADSVWEVGGVPQTSFVSPWALHSPRNEDFVAWQGRVEAEFVERVVDKVEAYLRCET